MSAPAYNPDTTSAHSALVSAQRVLQRYEDGLPQITDYSYASARDNARLAWKRYADAGMNIEAAKAWVLYQKLDVLADIAWASNPRRHR